MSETQHKPGDIFRSKPEHDGEPIGEYRVNNDGSAAIRGRLAVDAHGHLVLVPGNDDLPNGARWATEGDVEKAEKAEAERKQREKAEADRANARRLAEGKKADADKANKGGPLKGR